MEVFVARYRSMTKEIEEMDHIIVLPRTKIGFEYHAESNDNETVVQQQDANPWH
jgi:hypothetical protein